MYQRSYMIYERAWSITEHFYASGLQVAKMIGSILHYLHQDALGSTRLVSTAPPILTQFSSNYEPL